MKLKVKTLKEAKEERLITEMPVAVIGNWGGFKTKDLRIGKKGIELDWEYQDTIEDQHGHEIHIYKSNRRYIMGAWGYEGEKDVLVVITELHLLERKDLSKLYKNPFQASRVETYKGFKDAKYASMLYKWLIFEKKFTIISDMVQYDGARKLYNSISKDKKVICDVFDEQSDKILIHDTVPKQSYDNWDFDTDIWSYDFKKANIRLALYSSKK